MLSRIRNWNMQAIKKIKKENWRNSGNMSYIKFPKKMEDLDESYKSLMKELAKR